MQRRRRDVKQRVNLGDGPVDAPANSHLSPMKDSGSRRSFLNATTLTVGSLGMGGLSFLGRLPSVSAAEASIDKKTVRFDTDTEKLVSFLEETPRDRLLEE